MFFKRSVFINIAITFDRNYAANVVKTLDMLAITMILITMSRNAPTSDEFFSQGMQQV